MKSCLLLIGLVSLLMSSALIEPEIEGYKGNLTPELIDDGIEYNGWHYGLNGKWIPGMPTHASQFLVAPEVFIGDVWPYSYGVMEGTAKERGLSLDNVVDGVALMTCADIGSLVWLQRQGHDWEGPFKVVDCAQRNDLYNVIVHRNEAVEVGFKTAVKWGMATERKMLYGEWHNYWPNPIVYGVTVSKTAPDQLEDYEVINYSEWFLDNVIFDDFEDNEEAEAYYRSVPRMLYRPPTEEEGLPTWRIPPSVEFVKFE